MFRELSRKSKGLTKEECISILKEEKRGVLSVLGDNGYPYGMPMNHYYNEDDGALYFHQGHGGHRLDALNKSDKVSFCVINKGAKNENTWAETFKSVIVFGKIEVIDDLEAIEEVATKLSRKFTNDEEYIRKEIDCFAKKTLLLKLNIEHVSGKKIREE